MTFWELIWKPQNHSYYMLMSACLNKQSDCINIPCLYVFCLLLFLIQRKIHLVVYQKKMTSFACHTNYNVQQFK